MDVELPALASLPGEMPQTPGMETMLPDVSRRKSCNAPVTGLNASIQPLPKLPIRMLWLYGPKIAGRYCHPQGALNQSPC